MKKLKFSLYEVSTIEIWAAGTLLFCAGAASAGWAVGQFSTAGNAADWTAALGGVAAAAGTWAIGIGAIRYAHLGEQRQETAANAAADRADKIRAGQIHKLRLWAMLCNRAYERIKTMTDDSREDGISVAGAYGMLDGILVMLSPVDCASAAWELLDDKDLKIQIDLGICLTAFRRNVERFRERNPDRAVQFEAEKAGWKYPVETIEHVSDAGDRLLAAVDRLARP